MVSLSLCVFFSRLTAASLPALGPFFSLLTSEQEKRHSSSSRVDRRALPLFAAPSAHGKRAEMHLLLSPLPVFSTTPSSSPSLWRSLSLAINREKNSRRTPYTSLWTRFFHVAIPELLRLHAMPLPHQVCGGRRGREGGGIADASLYRRERK